MLQNQIPQINYLKIENPNGVTEHTAPVNVKYLIIKSPVNFTAPVYAEHTLIEQAVAPFLNSDHASINTGALNMPGFTCSAGIHCADITTYENVTTSYPDIYQALGITAFNN